MQKMKNIDYRLYQTFYENTDLSPELLEQIKSSKLIFFTKLFALIANFDGDVSEDEKCYMLDFYKENYPDEINSYLYSCFENFISEAISYQDIETHIQKDQGPDTFEEKIFILLKIYEMIFLKEDYGKEVELARKVGKIMGLSDYDINILEDIYMSRTQNDDNLNNSSINYIRIGSNLADCDVYLPNYNVEIDCINTEKFYCLIKQPSLTKVKIGKNNVIDKIANKIPYGQTIYVKNYQLSFEDLKLYFKIKSNKFPEKDFYLNQKQQNIILENTYSQQSLVKVLIQGSLVKLSSLREGIKYRINNQVFSQDVYVNLNDTIFINSAYFNLDKFIYQEFFEKTFIHLSNEKKSYSLSNYGGDIYISDKREKKWQGKIVQQTGEWYIDTGSCYHPVTLIRGGEYKEININRYRLLNRHQKNRYYRLLDGDILFIKSYVLQCNFKLKTLEQTYFSFKTIAFKNISYNFTNGTQAISNMSFEAEHGDMIAIMGPSGSGKTTLLNIINGNIAEYSGSILFDNFEFEKYYDTIEPFISYVPQDDVLFGNLTVFDNLYYNARLRFPDLSLDNIKERVENVLFEIGLEHLRDMIVGNKNDKRLSGGERKRLNIGLELLSDSYIYLFDEPTSGLSSKDSEKIIDILQGLARKGKFIFAVLHQPGSKIYNKFNKLLLLDYGGKLAFYGDSYNALRYFGNYINRKTDEQLFCSCCKRVEPELLLDSLEQLLKDIDGSVLPHRKYSPQFWEKKYRMKSTKTLSVEIPSKNPIPEVPVRFFSIKAKLKQFLTLFLRNFKNKLKDRANIFITFGEAPILAFIISFILKYTPFKDYNLYDNEHLSTFIFLTVIVVMFFSTSNSIDEILKDRALLKREKMLEIKKIRYLISKNITQMIFATIQNIIFLLISFFILEIKELYFFYFVVVMFLSQVGIALGLFVSAIPQISQKAAQNIMPLILIPQIIFGGSLIRYKEMNNNLTLDKKSPIPEICQVMPSRWAFESLIVAQSQYNSFYSGYKILQDSLDFMVHNKDSLLLYMGDLNYKQNKNRLLNKSLVAYRHKYKKKYGNGQIRNLVEYGQEEKERQILKAMNKNQKISKLQAESKIVFPMFTISKKIPFVNYRISTIIYNSIILAMIAFLLNFSTLILLKYHNQIVDFYKNIYRKFFKKYSKNNYS